MLKYLLVTGLLTTSIFASPSTISGPLYAADGTSLANGTVTIAWPNFSASDGHYVPAGSKVVVVSSGVFSQALEPSTNSSPIFSYKITYRFGSQSPANCSWVVSTSNAGIASVETCPTAASSIPATGISLSQISSGGGANGQCMILAAGVWSAQACTQSWTISVNDLYNSNTGNVAIGALHSSTATDKFQVACGSGTFCDIWLTDPGTTPGDIRLRSRSGLLQLTNNGSFLTMDNAGRIGIGGATFASSAPSYVLDVTGVSGAPGTTARFYDRTASTGITTVVLTPGANQGTNYLLDANGLGRFTTLNLSSFTGTARYLCIDTGGNVYASTSCP